MSRPARQKFDSIGDAHRAALISMGVIEDTAPKTEKGPQCPYLFEGVADMYRELKFIQRTTAAEVKLYHRDTLTWQDLQAYATISGRKLSILETELIMGIDAIFEGRNDG